MNTLLQHQRQFGLDLVRTIAIGLVLLSHLANSIDYLGFWGVELFFGLSGYLIGGILWRNFSASESWSGAQIVNFWSRRWWRTLPSYYLFLVVALIPAYIATPKPDTASVLPFLWFGQSFTHHDSWFYGVSWSLCIEEWFYLIFPLLLLICSVVGLARQTAYGLSIAVLFVGCFLIRLYLQANGANDDLRVITVGRLDAIACGVLVSFITSLTTLTDRQKRVLCGLGLALILLTVGLPFGLGMSYEAVKADPILLITAPLGGALILPWFGSLARPHSPLAKPLATGIEKVSLWSYSIYLCHLQLLTTIYYLQDYFGLADFRGTTAGNILTKTVGLTLILLLSAWLYNHFETPLTRRRPAELRPARKPVGVPL